MARESGVIVFFVCMFMIFYLEEKKKKDENSIDVFTNLTSITVFRCFNCFGFLSNCSFFTNVTLFFPMILFGIKLRLFYSYSKENRAMSICVTNT